MQAKHRPPSHEDPRIGDAPRQDTFEVITIGVDDHVKGNSAQRTCGLRRGCFLHMILQHSYVLDWTCSS